MYTHAREYRIGRRGRFVGSGGCGGGGFDYKAGVDFNYLPNYRRRRLLFVLHARARSLTNAPPPTQTTPPRPEMMTITATITCVRARPTPRTHGAMRSERRRWRERVSEIVGRSCVGGIIGICTVCSV